METNAQHYLNDILTLYLSGDSRCAFVRTNILKDSKCDFVTCSQCADRVKEWLNAQYEEPKIEVDWSKVPVDTPVIVKNSSGEEFKRYFAKYDNGSVFTFDYGGTSWSTKEPVNLYMSMWVNYRLAREEDIEKYCK